MSLLAGKDLNTEQLLDITFWLNFTMAKVNTDSCFLMILQMIPLTRISAGLHESIFQT